MTINEKLDAVLYTLSDGYDKAHEIIVTKTEHGTIETTYALGVEWLTFTEILVHLRFQNEDTSDLNFILQFLVNERKIESRKDNIGNSYRILFEGRLFIKNGGYCGTEKMKNAEKDFFQSMALRADKNAKQLNLLTAVLAIGTILSLWISAVDKFHLLGSIELWTGFFVFVSGGLVSVLLWLIYQQLMKKK